MIDAEAARLDRLVGGVLELSRIDSGALHPDLEPHDLRGVVEPALSRLRPRLGRRAIEVDLPPDLPPVLADEVLLDTVVTDLLENVANHSRPDAAVRVSRHGSGDAVSIRLTVEDGGPGVPAAALPTLFDRFARVNRPREGRDAASGSG